MHEVINEIIAPPPIFFQANSFKTSPISAEKFLSAFCSALLPNLSDWRGQIFQRLSDWRWQVCQCLANSEGVYSNIAFYIILENPQGSILSRSPIGAKKIFSTDRRGFIQIWMVKNRRWSDYFVNNFVHERLSTLKPIRAALTSRDLYSDTKFSQSQSRVKLRINDRSNFYFWGIN